MMEKAKFVRGNGKLPRSITIFNLPAAILVPSPRNAFPKLTHLLEKLLTENIADFVVMRHRQKANIKMPETFAGTILDCCFERQLWKWPIYFVGLCQKTQPRSAVS